MAKKFVFGIILGIFILGLLNSPSMAQCGRYTVRENIKFRLNYNLKEYFMVESADQEANHFGAGVELRTFQCFWLTANYYPSAVAGFEGTNWQFGMKFGLIELMGLHIYYLVGAEIQDIISELEQKRFVRGYTGLEAELGLGRHLKLAAAGKLHFRKTDWELKFEDTYLDFSSATVKIPKSSITASVILSF